MSNFENYDSKAKYYDNLRVPVGVQYLPNDIDEKVVLDAGSGTGNYIGYFIDRVKEYHSYEWSYGMINEQKAKYGEYINLFIKQGSLLNKLPYDDNTFDYVIVNQVIHHLSFYDVKKLIYEFYRVLKVGGEIYINHCTQKQLRAHWYYSLIPNATQKIMDKYVPIDKLIQYGNNAGLEVNGLYKVMEPIQGDLYFDIGIVLSEDLRNADSTWAVVEPYELQNALNIVKKNSRNAKKFINNLDANRRIIGQTTYIVFAKSIV